MYVHTVRIRICGYMVFTWENTHSYFDGWGTVIYYDTDWPNFVLYKGRYLKLLFNATSLPGRSYK